MIDGRSTQPPYSFERGFVADPASEGIGCVRRVDDEAPITEDVGRAIEQASLRIHRVHFEVLAHGAILAPTYQSGGSFAPANAFG
jgi:hypothetical protein